MKKLVLLCFLFVFSSTFYAQNSNTAKEPTKKKSAYDYNKDVNVKTPVKKEVVKKETKVLEKKVTAKKVTVSKETKNKVAKTIKETNEKAPKKADKITGSYNGKKVYTGPRGGKYYINKNGNKTYVQD